MLKINKLFYLSLFVILSEGILRKWIFPSLSSILFSLKYFVIMILWIKFLLIRKKPTITYSNYPYTKIFFIFFIYCILNIFVSYCSINTWFIGMVSYFSFLIYILVTPMVFNTQRKLDIFFKYLLIVSFIIFILGLIQFYLPPSHFLNTYSTESKYISTAGNATRITSIFNYITGNTTFLSFSIPIVLFFFFNEKKWYKKYFFFILLVLGIFNVFATGSRSIVAYTLISLFITSISYALFTNFTSNFRNISKILIFCILLYLMDLFNIFHFDSFFTFYDRISSINDSSTGRIDWMVNAIPLAIEKSGLIGFGIGSVNNISITMATSIFDLKNITFTSSELDQLISRMIFEMGIIGFSIYYILITLILLDITRKTFKMNRNINKVLSFVLLSTLVQYYMAMNSIIFNWLGSVHFYLVLGLIQSIFLIDKTQSKKEKYVY